MWCLRSKIVVILCLSGLGFWIVPCQAQYQPLYSQYMFNGLAINPAYAGSQEVLSLSALYRTQWLNYLEDGGAPATQTFSGDFPLRNPKIALGLLIYNDKVSIYRRTGFFGTYAFRFVLGPGKLSLGLQAGFEQMRADESNITTLEPNDPMFNYQVKNSLKPNTGFGVYYYTSRYFAGISVPSLLAYAPNDADSYKTEVSFNKVMVYGGLLIPFSKNVKVKPSMLLQYQETLLCDLNCNVILLPKETLEIGVSYRNASTLVAMAEVRINPQLCIGYAYDYTFGKLSITNGSHEFMLRYEFRYRVKAESPLYLK